MDDLLSAIRKLQDLYDDPDIVTTADQINRPEPKQEVKNIELVNEFVKRNPRADGGRINFDGGGTPLQKLRQEIVDSMKGYAPADVTEDQLQLVVKDITLDMTAEEAQASALSNFRKLFSMADGGRIGYSIGDRVDSIIPQNNLMDMSLEESTTGPSGYPMTAGFTTAMKVPSALKAIESGAANFNQAKKIVTNFFKQRQPYTGATKIGESTTKDFTPEKNFLSVLKSYMNKYTGGSLSQAAKDLGISRNILKGIDERINLQETGKRVSGLSFKNPVKISEPIDGLEYAQMTTLMKNDPNKFKILKGGENKFLDQESLGHYLGVKFARDPNTGTRANRGKFQYDQLGKALKDLNVKKNKLGEFNVDDAINKLLTKNKTKLVKGQRVSDAGKDRYTLEKKFDPELFSFRASLINKVGSRAKGLDVYLPNAVDDIGHPFSLSKSIKKYKKLFKDSNINSINTLVYQDHTLNTRLHQATGYELRYEKLFDQLAKLQNKKITPKIQEQLIDIKNQMNLNYTNYINILSDPKKIKQVLSKPIKYKMFGNSKVNITDDFAKYLSGQVDRVQKIDINIPKIGDTFKSKDLFVDMSTVNPKYIMGYVNQINPKAKKFKDLSMSEQAIFKQNALDQNADIVSEYYKKAKYPIDDVEAVKETIKMDFAKGGPVDIDLGFFAGGGIAKEAGDSSGPPPESGPTPQGLQGLFNRVKKV